MKLDWLGKSITSQIVDFNAKKIMRYVPKASLGTQ